MTANHSPLGMVESVSASLVDAEAVRTVTVIVDSSSRAGSKLIAASKSENPPVNSRSFCLPIKPRRLALKSIDQSGTGCVDVCGVFSATTSAGNWAVSGASGGGGAVIGAVGSDGAGVDASGTGSAGGVCDASTGFAGCAATVGSEEEE